MKTIRQINIKDRQSYFFNNMKNINDFDPSFKSDELVMT